MRCLYSLKMKKKLYIYKYIYMKCTDDLFCLSFFILGLFHAFDENRDNHIDFKEISCGLSACCRGPVAERQKCKTACSSKWSQKEIKPCGHTQVFFIMTIASYFLLCCVEHVFQRCCLAPYAVSMANGA